MRIVTKKPKYTTLWGDDINHNLFQRYFNSNALAAGIGLTTAFTFANTGSALATATIASIMLPFQAVLLASKKNIFQSMALSPFRTNKDNLLEQESLKKYTINTNPNPEESLDSLSKYSKKIQNSRGANFFVTGFSTLPMTLATMSLFFVAPKEIAMINMLALSPMIFQSLSQIRRFNKLASGEYAIVTTPPREEQEIVEKTFVTIPPFWEPAAEPQPELIPIPIRD